MPNRSEKEKDINIITPNPTQSLTSSNSNTLVTCFKPRQVLLNCMSKTKTTNMKQSKDKTPNSLSSQQRVLLFQSICHLFEQSGFSKSLQKFQKEAHVEKDSWKSCSLNVEEMCYEYLKSRDGAKVVDKAILKPCNNQTDDSSSPDDKHKEVVEHKAVDSGNVKSHKKKKSKSANDSSEQVTEKTQPKQSANPVEVTGEPAKKSKDKKKKQKEESECLNLDSQEKIKTSEASEKADDVDKKKKEKKEKSKSKKIEEDTMNPEDTSVGTTEVNKEKKVSKKRKKSFTEENVAGQVEESAVAESKRRKIDVADQSNGEVQPPKTPDGLANGVIDEDVGDKSQKQDKSKQRNGSTEPTGAKAFRRVNPEDVEFVDDRLQDNSYWAKGGADSGYGAKAQEILGQVRGRDFRHEKTKKKRGSYRGGLIDLQTHSVKFQYDDDDE